jgi:outer membrane protein assembly factor BamB
VTRRRWIIVAGVTLLIVLVSGAGIAWWAVHRSVADVRRGAELPFTPESTTTTAPTTQTTGKKPKDDWGAPWAMYGLSIDRTRDGSAFTKVKPPYGLRWKIRPGFLEYPPSYADGVLYLTTYGGVVSAYHVDTGKAIWKRKVPGKIVGQPVIYRDKVFFSTLEEGTIYAVSRKNGHTVWKLHTGERTESVPGVADGWVLFGSQTGAVRAIDADTGRVVWKFVAAGAVKGGPAVSGGRVYFGDYAGDVYCLRLRDGRQMWSTGTNGLAGGFSSGNFYATPAIRYGRVYISNTDGKVYSLVAATGQIAWTVTLSGWAYGSPAVSGGRVFATSFDRTFVALDARTGNTLWRHTLGNKTLSSPTVIDGLVYVAQLPSGGGKGRLYAYNPGNGRNVWQFPDGNYSSVIAAHDQLIVAGVVTLYALKPR